MANSRWYNISGSNPLFLLNLKLFIMLVGFYLLNQVVPTSTTGFRQYYFNDLLAMPLLLAYSQMLLYSKNIKLNVWHMLGLFIGCSMVWELVTPCFLNYSIPDILDVFAYSVGTLLYIIFSKMEGKK